MNDTGQMINVEFDTGFRCPIGTVSPPNAPFWTIRMPLQNPPPADAAGSDPLQMPAGTAIDLRASGDRRDRLFLRRAELTDNRGVNNADSIVIMFAPEGRVSRVSYNKNGLKPLDKAPFDQPVVDNVYLMIGRREGCPPPTVASDATLDSSKLSPI